MLEVARIEKASFSDPWSLGEFRGLLSSPYAIFLVATDEQGNVSGYVVTTTVMDESEILNIAVDPAFRGMSLGAMLLDRALDEAGKLGSKATFLEVREANEPAIRLYRSRGFEEISRRRKYYSAPVEDALVLRRGNLSMT